MSVVRTDGRAGGRSVYGHVITKFSRMGSLPHFFTHGAPLRASRARPPLLTTIFLQSIYNKIKKKNYNEVTVINGVVATVRSMKGGAFANARG